MTRFVIALFSQSFPRPLPHAWREAWRMKLAKGMDGVLALFLLLFPWVAMPAWFDVTELPRLLCAIALMSVWLLLRGGYSFLGSLVLEDGAVPARRWSALTLWGGVLGLVLAGAWVAAPVRTVAWLGNGVQISTSLLTLFVAMWLVGAVRESLQRRPGVGRFFTRTWFTGMCLALGLTLFGRAYVSSEIGSVLFSAGRVLDVWLFAPVVFLVGLSFLATRAKVVAPLSVGRLFLHRASHALCALLLAALLVGASVIQLGGLWMIVLVGSLVGGIVIFFGAQARQLALFMALLGILTATFGMIAPGRGWFTQAQQTLHLDSLVEVLPSQALSWQVVGSTLTQSPLFGAGPGQWIAAFDRTRPVELNQTLLWNVSFPRAASFVATFLTEYGLLPALLLGVFFAVLLVVGVRRVVQTRDEELAWTLLILSAALAFAALRPSSVLFVMSCALFVGMASAVVFPIAKQQITWSEHRLVNHALLGTCLLLGVVGLSTIAQRAAAAELLTQSDAYAIPLARRLNPADDFTFQSEAQLAFTQAQLAADRADLTWIMRAEHAIAEARTRNPQSAVSVALALQIAQLHASLDQTKEDQVFTLATELDTLRPMDPSAPLAVFGVERQRALREARWVEQGQGREKEEAIQREEQAKKAAEQALQESLRRKSDYLPALYAQASWLAEAGKTTEAIQGLEALARVNAYSPDIQIPLAVLYRRNQEPQKAVAVLRALVDREPTNLEYQWQLSLALVQAEAWDEATSVLQRLVGAAPQQVQYQTQLKEVLRRRAYALAPQVVAPLTPPTTTTSTVKLRKTPVRRRVTR